MHVLFAAQVPLDVPSGGSAHVAGLSRGLAQLGHRVTLMAPSAHLADGAVEHAPPPRRRRPGARLEAWMAIQVARLPARALPDVAYVRVCPSTSLLSLALAQRRIPTWLSLHGPILDELREAGRGRVARAVVRHQLARAIRRARGLVGVDEALAQWAREQLGATRVRVVPVGVDLDVVTPGDRGSARRRLDLDPARPLVVLAGTLGSGLRLDLLAPALRALPGVDVAVVGDGPQRAALERALHDAGVASRVRLPGRRPRAEAVAWMQAADVCLDLRDRHAGTRSLEYAALGRRSVALETPGSERLRALYAPPLVELVGERSPAALAAAIRRSLDRDRTAGPAGPAAVSRARAQLGWDRAAREVAALLAGPASDTAARDALPPRGRVRSSPT